MSRGIRAINIFERRRSPETLTNCLLVFLHLIYLFCYMSEHVLGL